mmetsp:Transcript_18494/g.46333  ORF Transcript_18494/g.46333 Transcript_18494/m.46333 type:complete len:299 (-) Transcript_18494:7-903(-)
MLRDGRRVRLREFELAHIRQSLVHLDRRKARAGRSEDRGHNRHSPRAREERRHAGHAGAKQCRRASEPTDASAHRRQTSDHRRRGQPPRHADQRAADHTDARHRDPPLPLRPAPLLLRLLRAGSAVLRLGRRLALPPHRVALHRLHLRRDDELVRREHRPADAERRRRLAQQLPRACVVSFRLEARRSTRPRRQHDEEAAEEEGALVEVGRQQGHEGADVVRRGLRRVRRGGKRREGLVPRVVELQHADDELPEQLLAVRVGPVGRVPAEEHRHHAAQRELALLREVFQCLDCRHGCS